MSKLSDALAAVNKQFGKGTIMPLNSSAVAEGVDIISTGHTEIDALTGIGGIPRGRVTEIYGPEAGGKTTLALQIAAQAQKISPVVYIDAEHTLDPAYAAALGVNTDELLISQPDCGEDALEIALAMVNAEVAAVIVDSVAALVPRGELEGEMGDAQMGAMGRLMSQAMRKLVIPTARANTALIFVNQVRDKLGVMFGSPETTSGGRALKFAASIRIDVRRKSSIKKGSEIIGNEVQVRCQKNKFAGPFKQVDLPLMFGKGFVYR